MRLGVHNAELAASLGDADRVYVYVPPDLGWDPAAVLAPLGAKAAVFTEVESIVTEVAAQARAGDQVLVMSNGGFQGIHQRLLDALGSAERRHRGAAGV
jgi:UDP-N-acetylmuramate: L-alanyl-gamma-D-glutamyl-meso-diaminopimelate ligase